MISVESFMDPKLITYIKSMDSPEIFKVNASICFWDITSFSRTFNSAEAQHSCGLEIAQDFFSLISEAVIPSSGILHKFMGDGAIALFSNDNRLSQNNLDIHASIHEAIKTALSIQKKFNITQKIWVDKFPQDAEIINSLALRCGINTGNITVGVIKAFSIYQFILFGHHVNLSSRLCSNAADNSILISESTKKILPSIDNIVIEPYKTFNNLKNIHGEYETWVVSDPTLIRETVAED